MITYFIIVLSQMQQNFLLHTPVPNDNKIWSKSDGHTFNCPTINKGENHSTSLFSYEWLKLSSALKMNAFILKIKTMSSLVTTVEQFPNFLMRIYGTH